MAVDNILTGGAGLLAYDPAGNRLVQTDPVTGDITTFAYDNGNQLLHADDVSGSTTYTYDENGNQQTIEEPSGDITTNTWDGENRLVQVEHPSGDVTTNAYNSDGLRVAKDDGVAETRYVHDGNNVLLLQTDDVGTVEAEMTYIPLEYADVVSQRRDGDSSFYLFDGIHNVRQLTDDSQVVTDEYSFDGWGNLISPTGSTANSQLWKGQSLAYRQDPDAGPEVQYALHHRNYNPKTGVFTSADPAKDDSNLYRYVKNNPVNRTDPSGLEDSRIPPLPNEGMERYRSEIESLLKKHNFQGRLTQQDANYIAQQLLQSQNSNDPEIAKYGRESAEIRILEIQAELGAAAGKSRFRMEQFQSTLEVSSAERGDLRSRDYANLEAEATRLEGAGDTSGAKQVRDMITDAGEHDRSESTDYIVGSDAMAAAHDQAKENFQELVETADQYTFGAVSLMGEVDDAMHYAINGNTYYSTFGEYDRASENDTTFTNAQDPLTGWVSLVSSMNRPPDPTLDRMARDQRRENYNAYRREGYDPQRDLGHAKVMYAQTLLEMGAGEVAGQFFIDVAPAVRSARQTVAKNVRKQMDKLKDVHLPELPKDRRGAAGFPDETPKPTGGMKRAKKPTPDVPDPKATATPSPPPGAVTPNPQIESEILQQAHRLDPEAVYIGKTADDQYEFVNPNTNSKFTIPEQGQTGSASTATPAVDSVAPAATTPRSHSSLVDDFRKNPGDWERTGAQVGPSPARKTKGQMNVETQWRNKKTGEELSTHEVGGTNNPHPEAVSPNLPEGGGVRPRSKAKELR